MTAAAPRRKLAIMTMTDAAAKRVAAIMQSKSGEVLGLKVGIKKGGCAGMEYTMEWATEVGKFDEVVEQDDARVIVDPKAVMYLLGTEMDYVVSKLSAQFVFNNPNQKSACGCGESVNLVPVSKDKFAQV